MLTSKQLDTFLSILGLPDNWDVSAKDVANGIRGKPHISTRVFNCARTLANRIDNKNLEIYPTYSGGIQLELNLTQPLIVPTPNATAKLVILVNESEIIVTSYNNVLEVLDENVYSLDDVFNIPTTNN